MGAVLVIVAVPSGSTLLPISVTMLIQEFSRTDVTPVEMLESNDWSSCSVSI